MFNHNHRRFMDRLLVNVTPPSGEPVTLEDAKLYLRLDGNVEDTLIRNLITMARMSAEQFLRKSLMTQTWKIAYHDWFINNDKVPLPMGPVNSIASVIVVNLDDSTQTIDSSAYWLDAAHRAIVFYNVSVFGYIIGSHIEITYNTGYGDACAVPMPIKQGMMAHIVSMYENRGDVSQGSLPDQTTQLYMPYREVRL